MDCFCVKRFGWSYCGGVVEIVHFNCVLKLYILLHIDHFSNERYHYAKYSDFTYNLIFYWTDLILALVAV
jgi:hypothetical protein